MIPSEENKKIRQNIKDSVVRGDVLRLFRTGLDNFWNVLCSRKSMTFQQFLEDSGVYHDKFISDTCKQEHLSYAGGKMLIELEQNQTKVVPIQLSAKFYFQTQNQEWILKEREGRIVSSQFSDWNTDEMAANLRRTGKLEFSIESPE